MSDEIIKEFEEKPKTRKRGRPTKNEQEKQEKEQAKKEEQLKNEKISSATELVKTGLSALNEILFRQLPDDLKKAGCDKLSENELNAITGATVPVLDKYGLLDVSNNPEIVLLATVITITIPRVQAVKKYRTEKTIKEVIEEPKK